MTYCRVLHFSRSRKPGNADSGGVPEWSNGAVSKTVVRLRTVGSNPTPSANFHLLRARANPALLTY